MMPTVQIELSKEASDLLGRISDRKGVLTAIAREMDIQNDLTISHLVAQRLTGKGPFPVSEHRLGEVTHLLRRSPRATKAFLVGQDTVVSAIGSNVKYAGIHEFGGTIKRVLLAGSVRLRTDKRGNLLRQGKNGKLAIFAKDRHKLTTTVAYAGGKRYEVVIPARAPFWHAISDRAPATGAAVSQAIVRFWEGGAS